MQRRRREGLRSLAELAFGSPCGFLKDQFIQCQVRVRPAQPLVLLLQIFHSLSLIGLEAAILLAPTIICLLADCDPPACLGSRGPLRQHDLNFTQLADDLFRLVLLAWRLSSLSWSRLS